MSEPNSFCSIATKYVKYSTLLLLQTLSLYHSDKPFVLFCDTKTKRYLEKNKESFSINVIYHNNLDEFTMTRDEMTAKKLFGKFLEKKMDVLKNAIEKFGDSLFLDTDQIIFSKINDINKSKEFGIAKQYIKDHSRTGKYNAGFFWTKNLDVCDYWKELIDHRRRCPEQVNMHKLCDKFSFFEFTENYNLMPTWFFPNIGIESSRRMKAHFRVIENVTKEGVEKSIVHRNMELKTIHTHFEAGYSQFINQYFLEKLNECKNRYGKELLFIEEYMFNFS